MSLFPHDAVRPEQDALIQDVAKVISERRNLIAHAPTGLGKTAASLSPCLEYALKHKKTVFFLTSRHTQHALAINTLRSIRRKHRTVFSVVDMLGKKNMCARSEVAMFPSGNFPYYCKSLRESDGCEFYSNFKERGIVSDASWKAVSAISGEPMHAQESVAISKRQSVCPYEVAALASKNASVIIGDYYHLFNPDIRASFLSRSSTELQDVIAIVDEAHNLPDRLREMLTRRLSSRIIKQALREARDNRRPSVEKFLHKLDDAFSKISKNSGNSGGAALFKDATWKPNGNFGSERAIEKEELMDLLSGAGMEDALAEMEDASKEIVEEEGQSSIASVAEFLGAWQESDEGFSRFVSSRPGSGNKEMVEISFTCLDPSIEVRDFIKQLHSVVLMSGTLTPTSMFRELLGFPENTVEKEYRDPMPKENRLSLIVTGATTKYSSRNEREFAKIGSICSKASEAVPGNVAVFFPSYALMEQIHPFLRTEKEIFKEHKGLSKEEKDSILSEFRQSSDKGGILLAVVGGSFSEGVDLPGKLLNGVLIVGLPLGMLDLQTKALIDYYQERYGKGWDYGYTFPAFTKALQTAGRCIRTELDRGVILFIDSRYASGQYYRCFPKDSSPKITGLYMNEIEKFFS